MTTQTKACSKVNSYVDYGGEDMAFHRVLLQMRERNTKIY